MAEAFMVGMAEIKIGQTPEDVLIALGLGSCIGICAYDPQAGIAGMVHVVLPDSTGYESCPAKFADTAVPLLLDEMLRAGASHRRLRIALAGGAQLFAFGGSGTRLEIGPRNTDAVKAALAKHGLSITAADVGGNSGRTLQLFMDGRVRVKTIGRGEQELTCLGKGDLPGTVRTR